jgi:Fe-Mn family superoxide dismutase
MVYEPKNFDSLLGTKGFSDQLLKNHFTLYQGYVTNTNKLADALSTLAKEGKTGTPEYSELKRRFGWEWNGMRLHEYYFGNIIKGGKAIDKSTNFYKKIVDDFGSYENWEKDFRAVGSMRGIGWAVLYYDGKGDQIFNSWINEHDVGHLSGASPMLVMDVFEHAFMIDYGLKRADYIEAFFKAIDWTIDPDTDKWMFKWMYEKREGSKKYESSAN